MSLAAHSSFNWRRHFKRSLVVLTATVVTVTLREQSAFGVSCNSFRQTSSPAIVANGDTLPESFADTLAEVMKLLREKNPQKHDRVHDHELPPLLPKKLWSALAGHVKKCEGYVAKLPEDKWISLRLDGCHWGSLLQRLKRAGILSAGFSERIAEAMMDSCCAVMRASAAVLGYTHSDEMTVLIPPGRRAFAGDLQRWISFTASVATECFNRRLLQLATEQNIVLDDVIIAHFDCRAGVFSSPLEAQSLILWRAQDCTMNSASDAIKFSDAPISVRSFNTIEKLSYLQARKMLPLRRHQGYGSLFVKANSTAGDEGIILLNDPTKDRPRQVLNIARQGSLLPMTHLTEGELQHLGGELPFEL